uniref:(northern house mosquito) hypothetical protein n=1 Tax=Culex pipiens TaxID=7175 RepID=A0A8D8NJ74_CULPI
MQNCSTFLKDEENSRDKTVTVDPVLSCSNVNSSKERIQENREKLSCLLSCFETKFALHCNWQYKFVLLSWGDRGGVCDTIFLDIRIINHSFCKKLALNLRLTHLEPPKTDQSLLLEPPKAQVHRGSQVYDGQAQTVGCPQTGGHVHRQDLRRRQRDPRRDRRGRRGVPVR